MADSGIGVVNAESEHDDRDAAGDHRDDGSDLHEREPEFQFAENLDAQQVYRADEEDDSQNPDPSRYVREPELHVQAEGGDVGEAHDHHLERVRPPGHETGEWSEVLVRVLAERTGNRVTDRHLAERSQHQVDRDTADQVGQEHRRAGSFDGLGAAVEQSGSDG